MLKVVVQQELGVTLPERNVSISRIATWKRWETRISQYSRPGLQNQSRRQIDETGKCDVSNRNKVTASTNLPGTVPSAKLPPRFALGSGKGIPEADRLVNRSGSL